MVITFCGHSDYIRSEADEGRVLKILESIGGGRGEKAERGGGRRERRKSVACCESYFICVSAGDYAVQ